MFVTAGSTQGAARSRRRESAFTIVEVIVATFVLAIVIVGATMMFANTSSSTSASRVRDKQTAVANNLLARLQSDTSWAEWCRSRQPAGRTVATCPIEQWLRTQPGLQNGRETVRDAGSTLTFRIGLSVVGVDIAADGRGNADEGTFPDMYRLTATVAPDAALRSRYPKLQPLSIIQESNPSNRIVSGRLTITACVAVYQADERAAAGNCDGAGYSAPLQMPAGFDTGNCATPGYTEGGKNRDCLPFKCASVALAPRFSSECAGLGGWAGSSPRPEFTRMMIDTATGNVNLRSVSNGRTYGPYRLQYGTVQVRDLPVGRYRISLNPTNPGRYDLWRAKSVPSSTEVAVEPGLNSRAVIMFRPAKTGTVRIKVTSTNATIPWEAQEFPSYVQIDKNGNFVNGTDTIRMVPVPKGRLLWNDTPQIRVPVNGTVSEFVFTGVEPGLYSYELGDPDYRLFKQPSQTAGFIFVYPNGTVYFGTRGQPTWDNGMCAKNIRDNHLGETHTDPATGYTWPPLQSCDTGAGPGAGSGGSGGGAT